MLVRAFSADALMDEIATNSPATAPFMTVRSSASMRIQRDITGRGCDGCGLWDRRLLAPIAAHPFYSPAHPAPNVRGKCGKVRQVLLPDVVARAN